MRAANDGIVSLARVHMALTGGTVVVDHGYGLVSAYFHMAKLEVRAGERVRKGELLGYSGSEGVSTGAHLHFEIRLHGLAVSPRFWVSGALPNGRPAPGFPGEERI